MPLRALRPCSLRKTKPTSTRSSVTSALPASLNRASVFPPMAISIAFPTIAPPSMPSAKPRHPSTLCRRSSATASTMTLRNSSPSRRILTTKRKWPTSAS
nr:MAG: internal scaffolding protein [Microviridae sp.]